MSVKQLLKQIKNKKSVSLLGKEKYLIINGEVLDNQTVLEDAEIGDNDTILVEFKINDR